MKSYFRQYIYDMIPVLPFQGIYHYHLHPLQAANCCRNSRLVVDEDELMWLKK